MFLENLVIDAVDPGRLGRFWQQALGTEQLTDVPEGFETRLHLDGGAYLDLCFPRVPEAPREPQRLHLDLLDGGDQQATAQRLRDLGASDLDIGQGDAPWIVLGDVEGNPFCVLEHRDAFVRTGPIASLPLDVADPDAAAGFWSWLTGWADADGCAPRSLRHPSGSGPLLEMCPEPRPKPAGTKNRMHVDIRLEAADDEAAIAAEILERGGAEPDHDWGELPWRTFTDPSGNELCLLRAYDA